MIYQALADLALREALVENPAYEPKEVAHLIHLGAGGRYLGIESPRLEPARNTSRFKSKPPVRPVPRRSDRTVQNQAEFLVDKAEYVFGIDPTGSRDGKKLSVRRQLFRDFVAEARNALHVEALDAVLTFLDAPTPDELVRLLNPENVPERADRAGELFAFVFDPQDSTRCVHDDPKVRAWFADRLASEGEDLRGQCLVTGESGVPLTRLHGKPKGIPPKSRTKGGVPLTTVNESAFKSYQLDHVGCAPISLTANIAVETALNRLLDPAYKKPDGTVCERRSIVISADTVVVYWSKEDAGIDWFGEMETEPPERVGELLRSPYKARPAPLDDPAAFYALILSGGQGRAIVRSFLQSTVQEVARAIDRYRDEVRIIRPYGEGAGGFGLNDYRRAIVPRRDLDLLPAPLASDLYLAILNGRHFPRSVVHAIIRRNRAEFLPKRERSTGRDEMLLATRCSLLKAYLLRNAKENITVALDKTRPDPPYRLGRLFAVVDKLQQDALGNVNATIVDRYYGSASTTPEAVFPTLFRRSQHHIGKLRREKPGLAVNTEKLLQEIVADLEHFPKTMTLEQQSLFALGFYHQRQDFYTKGDNS